MNEKKSGPIVRNFFLLLTTCSQRQSANRMIKFDASMKTKQYNTHELNTEKKKTKTLYNWPSFWLFGPKRVWLQCSIVERISTIVSYIQYTQKT